MNKTAAFNILKDINLVIEHYQGKIFVEDIINLKESLFSNELYHPECEMIMDMRKADLMIDKADLSKFIQFAKINIDHISERNVSFLTSKPNQVVIGLLFNSSKGNLPMNLKVFSTLKHSIRWLEINDEELDRINNILKNLSEKNTNNTVKTKKYKEATKQQI